jgi:uncharacterized protein YfaS (alpha-2-macroglobulin family)
MALEALVGYYRSAEREAANFAAAVSLNGIVVGSGRFEGRTAVPQTVHIPIADLVAPSGREGAALTLSREGTGRLFYTARLQYLVPEPPDAIDHGIRVERRYDRHETSSSTTTPAVAMGDLVRVTISVTLRGEGRFLALTDTLPAGLEPIDGWLRTTASDLAAGATRVNDGAGWLGQWRRGTFDHVEKHDDRVVAYATRLGSGRHEFSYLARATTPGTFTAAGTRVEAMYAPEVMGKGSASTLTIR